MQSENDELFGQELLASFWKSESLNNLTLKGTDGMEVEANRYILAAKSKVFENMLLGKFKEASSSVVIVGYPGETIEKIVEYIYTDSVVITIPKKRKAEVNDNDTDEEPQQFAKEFVHPWISLLKASVYFDLPRLRRKVVNGILENLRKCPNAAFPLLEAVQKDDMLRVMKAELSFLTEQSLETIGFLSFQMVKASDIKDLSPVTFELILKDRHMHMTEFELFKLLEIWGENLPQHGDRDDHQSILQNMLEHINLSKISLKHLSEVVRPSGLLSTEQLEDGYEKAMQQPTINPEIPRSLLFRIYLVEDYTAPIKVVGAGQSEVNGVYRLNGYTADGKPGEIFPRSRALRYSKKGKYQGNEVTFFISFFQYYWRLSIGHPDNGDYDDEDVYFTRVLDTSSNFHAPPEGKWAKWTRDPDPLRAPLTGFGAEPYPSIKILWEEID